MLEEAGEEDFLSVINTLHSMFQKNVAFAFIAEVEEDLKVLLRLELVAICQDDAKPGFSLVPLEAAEVKRLLRLADIFTFDEGEGYWRYAEEKYFDCRFSLVLTDKGNTALTA
jgi:hypothetical protein